METAEDEPSILSIPNEIMIKILSDILCDVRDVEACAMVCQSFRRASSSPLVWKALAYHRYGAEVAEATLGLYNGDWRLMVADDNCSGAIPTLTYPEGQPKLCHWRLNTNERFYCCMIQCIKWHRPSGELHLYIDVRGESDLRHPFQSSLILEGEELNRIEKFPRASSWHSESPPIPGHYKGCLVFPTNVNFHNVDYAAFIYANDARVAYGDYFRIPLFAPHSGEVSLADAFGSSIEERCPANGSTNCRRAANYTLNVSPFAGDSPQVERARWEKAVPQEVLERHINVSERGARLREWWV